MYVYMYICMYCEFSYYKGNAIYSSMFRYFLYYYIYKYVSADTFRLLLLFLQHSSSCCSYIIYHSCCTTCFS